MVIKTENANQEEAFACFAFVLQRPFDFIIYNITFCLHLTLSAIIYCPFFLSPFSDFDPALGMMTGIPPITPMMPGLGIVPPPIPPDMPVVKEIIHCKSCTLFPPNPSTSLLFLSVVVIVVVWFRLFKPQCFRVSSFSKEYLRALWVSIQKLHLERETESCSLMGRG